MQTLTRSGAAKAAQRSIAVVSRVKAVDAAGETRPSSASVSLPAWRITEVAEAAEAPALAFPEGPFFSPAPPCVHTFVQAVAQIAGVLCVVAEEVDGAVHVTTFVEGNGSREQAERIYSIEAETIGANPALMFDFHVRRGADVNAATPEMVSGAHFFAVWGALENAESR